MTDKSSYDWKPAPHTADLAISISATEPSGLFYAALAGLLGLNEFSQDPHDKSEITKYCLNISVECIEEALVDFLNECIFQMEVEELIPFKLLSVQIDGREYDMVLHCRPVTSEELKSIGHIKAATYSALEVRQKEGLYVADLIFDT